MAGRGCTPEVHGGCRAALGKPQFVHTAAVVKAGSQTWLKGCFCLVLPGPQKAAASVVKGPRGTSPEDIGRCFSIMKDQ